MNTDIVTMCRSLKLLEYNFELLHSATFKFKLQAKPQHVKQEFANFEADLSRAMMVLRLAARWPRVTTLLLRLTNIGATVGSDGADPRAERSAGADGGVQAGMRESIEVLERNLELLHTSIKFKLQAKPQDVKQVVANFEADLSRAMMVLRLAARWPRVTTLLLRLTNIGPTVGSDGADPHAERSAGAGGGVQGGCEIANSQ